MSAVNGGSVDAENIQNVMQDILAIRRSITSYQQTKDGQIGVTTLKAKATLQITALVLMAVLIGIEVFGHSPITRTLLANAHDKMGGIIIVSAIGAFLALCVGVMYFVIMRAATRTQESLDSYVRRNFVYLQNLSHISDLAVKFAVLSAFIMGGRPDWVSPFLLIFTADYLIQGRFFTLSIRQSQFFALLSICGAAVMFFLQIAEVLWPLLWYFGITAISMHRLHRMKKVDD